MYSFLRSFLPPTSYLLRTRWRSGQVMILTVLALGGTMLGATTIAGLLMLYQLRQANDLGNSARAIFAADAGMEWAFYNLFCGDDPGAVTCPLPDKPAFTNGASVDIFCTDSSGAAADCDSADVRRIRSVGKSNAANRAFEATF